MLQTVRRASCRGHDCTDYITLSSSYALNWYDQDDEEDGKDQEGF